MTPITFFQPPDFDSFPITTQTVCTQFDGQVNLLLLFSALVGKVERSCYEVGQSIFHQVKDLLQFAHDKKPIVLKDFEFTNYYPARNETELESSNFQSLVQADLTLLLSSFPCLEMSCKPNVQGQALISKRWIRHNKRMWMAAMNKYQPQDGDIRYVRFINYTVGCLPLKKYKIKYEKDKTSNDQVIKSVQVDDNEVTHNEAFMNQVTVDIMIDGDFINVKIFPDCKLVFAGCKKPTHARDAALHVYKLLLQLSQEHAAIPFSMNPVFIDPESIGANKPAESSRAATLIASKLTNDVSGIQIPQTTPPLQLQVSMTNIIVKLGFFVNLYKLDMFLYAHPELGFYSTFDPSEKPSLTCSYSDDKETTHTFTVFMKGTVIHSGKDYDLMREPFNRFMKMIDQHMGEFYLRDLMLNKIFLKHYRQARAKQCEQDLQRFKVKT